MNAIHHINHANLAPQNALILDTGKHINKASLLSALGKSCQFPDYYATNLDSAWDCLQDAENIPHLLLNTQNKTIHKEELKAFTSLIIDAYDAWGYPELWIIQ